MKTDPTIEKTLTGVITPFGWGENDEVLSVALSATDEQEYLIENTQPFIPLLHHPVRVTGTVKRIENQNIIRIKSYQVVKDVHADHYRCAPKL